PGEDQSDHLSVLVDYRRTRVAADYVRVSDEVQWRLHVDRSFRALPALRNVIRVLVPMLGSVFPQAGKVGERHVSLAFSLVAFHSSVRESQSKRRVRVHARALDYEQGFRNLRVVRT